eukprot:4299248-Prymnesium_polylepis.2
MIHIPKAHEVFDAGGLATGAEDKWRSYGARTWSQLEWWGAAAAAHKLRVDPFAGSGALLRDPSQRNAPGGDGV